MQANTIPGTANIMYKAQRVGIMIIDLEQFQRYSATVVDMAEQRKLWIERHKK